MRVVVHRVDAPLVPRLVVRRFANAIYRRVAHVHVRRRHVDFGAQHARAILELASAHTPKQVEVLLDGPVPVRAVAPRLGQGAAILAYLLARQVIDVCLASEHEPLCELVKLLEVVRGVELAVAPLEAEPTGVFLLRFDVLRLFSERVGVVEPEVAQPVEVPSDSEVQVDGRGVTEVQVAVRFRRPASVHPPPESARLVVLDNPGTYEVASRWSGFF